ncbi:sugar phosphate isomerase/epimerase family protein [Mucilaginibacter sp. UYCu711]|uniref:sugar phosphate isomerase/epimerase family protein n=1 Tax=Mucilaginibacter sp. UYCu711 TaxID=3156339 RepID=UPI003D21539C
MNNRRSFLKNVVLATSASVILPDFLAAATSNIAGLQLYSLREQLPHDVKATISRVARAGYKEVETFGFNPKTGYWGLSVKEFRDLLDANGLYTPSGHYGINEYFSNGNTDELSAYIKVAHALGQQYIIVPSLREEFIRTKDDFKRVAGKMNTAGELLKKEGLKLAYHNHNFEWAKSDGTTFYETLLTETDPKLLFMEMDIYWVVRAGQDPIEIFNNNPGRFRLVHIKDMDKVNPNLNTEAGNGSIDFKSIIPRAKAAGVKHFILEQENYTNIDPFVSLTKSAAYIKNVLKV